MVYGAFKKLLRWNNNNILRQILNTGRWYCKNNEYGTNWFHKPNYKWKQSFIIWLLLRFRNA